MSENIITIRDADWVTDNEELKRIRREVFIIEQQVPEELEWDTEDTTARHCIVMVNDSPVATGRLQADGQLGRMAVLKDYRHRGIGSMIMRHLINRHKTQFCTPLFIHAQKQALEFYERFDFIKDGNEFMEAGIPHYLMMMKDTTNI